MTKRTVGAALVIAFVVVATWSVTDAGPLGGCQVVVPTELPSGRPPGPGIEDVSAGAKQFVWGSGSDRVEELVGLDFYDASVTRLLAVVEIHGNPAKVFRIAEDSEGWDLAASWAGFDCSYTIFLAPRTTLEQAVEYAGRF